MIGVGGFFRNRIKYLKTKRDELNVPDVDIASDQMDRLQLSPEEDLQFLQRCVIKTTDPVIIAAKLKSTQKLRAKMLLDANIDLRTSFPFFSSNPELVNSIFFSSNSYKILSILFSKIVCSGFCLQCKFHM